MLARLSQHSTDCCYLCACFQVFCVRVRAVIIRSIVNWNGNILFVDAFGVCVCRAGGDGEMSPRGGYVNLYNVIVIVFGDHTYRLLSVAGTRKPCDNTIHPKCTHQFCRLAGIIAWHRGNH